MKRLISLIYFTLAIALPILSQSYSSLWEQAERAIIKDQPRSALDIIKRVLDKAVREGEEAQELRATLVGYTLTEQISPDSAKAVRYRMEQTRNEKRQARKESAALLWDAALSRIYTREWRDTTALNASRECLARTMADSSIQQLGTTTTKDFSVLFQMGRDSHLFGDDLLSILATDYLTNYNIPLEKRRATALRLTHYYKKRGNANAEFYFALRHALLMDNYSPQGEQSDKVKALLGLIREYDHLPLCVEAYIALTEIWPRTDLRQDAAEILRLARQGEQRHTREKRSAVLRNFIRELETPSLSLNLGNRLFYPGQSVEGALNTRNVKSVELRLSRTTLSAPQAEPIEYNIKQIRKAVKGKSTTLTYVRPDLPAYAFHQDTIRFSLPDMPGVYLMDLYADGRLLSSSVAYVSTVRPVILALSRDQVSITLVDARSGHPIANGSIMKYDRSNKRQVSVTPVDQTGSITLTTDPDKAYQYRYYVTTPGDAAATGFFLNTHYSLYDNRPQVGQAIELFTDRAIYRPGQQLSFGLVAHRHTEDEYAVVRGLTLKARLYNTNNKAIDSLTLNTDTMGVASGHFSLPATCLPGLFRIEVRQGGLTASTSFHVEEYKRPTFRVETDEIIEAYALGDTATLHGRALSYSGLPIEGARVKWSTRRSQWWRGGPNTITITGEGVTDAEGRFAIPVALTATEEERDPRNLSSFYFATSIDVTAQSGETAMATHTLRTASRPSWLTISWPDMLCRENLPVLEVKHYAANGAELKTKAQYTIRRKEANVAEGVVTAGDPFPADILAALPSGEYNITFRAGEIQEKGHFVLFSEQDTRPATGSKPLWAYERPSQSGDETYIMVGSPLSDAIIFYDLIGSNGERRSERLAVSDTIHRFTLRHDPRLGESQRAYFALFRDGRLHTFECAVSRAIPDKRLMLRWTSFRSELTPGAEEEWRLRVTLPDGRPAQASIMARLYDASLDAFTRRDWRFDNIRFLRRGVTAYLETIPSNGLLLHGSKEYKREKTAPLSFTSWRNDLFDYHLFGGNARQKETTLAGTHSGIRVQGYGKGHLAKSLAMADMAAPRSANKLEEKAAEATMEPSPDITPRTHFAETAFFRPALRTDDDGQVCIAFTLPQSLTSWNFTALAHTAEMRHGRLDTTIVARKSLMVQPALPRFVRRGDKAILPTTLRNLTDRNIEAKVWLTLTDPVSGKTIKKERKSLNLPASGSATTTFNYEAKTNLPLLVCRITAEGGGHTDGEEHYLPILADETLITRSTSFTLSHPGEQRIGIDTLFAEKDASNRSLTVELVGHPAWYAGAALPTLAGATCHSALDWSSRLYALALSEHIAHSHPDLRNQVMRMRPSETLSLNRLAQGTAAADETPWLAETEQEAERTAALQALFDEDLNNSRFLSALDNLRALQQPDGAWSWYRGMPGNAFVTAETAVMLARVEYLTGNRQAHALLEKAMQYLSARIAKDIATMKQEEKSDKRFSLPTDTHLRYLYARSLMNLSPDADVRFLIDRIKSHYRSLSLFGKARAIVILDKAGEKEAAESQLKSLMEYTVRTADMGRYFDTPRAQQTAYAYRIPTQAAAIEALLYMQPDTEALSDMRLWLMQSKRTQMWETSNATVDAIYALLLGAPKDDPEFSLTADPQLTFRLLDGNTPLGDRAHAAPASDELGYIRKTFTEPTATRADILAVKKAGKPLAWGSVHATYTVPTARVQAGSNGLRLERRFEVKRGNDWQPLTRDERLLKGDRLRQVFTIHAERDFDFVALRSARAACLEPARPLSGYAWADGLGAYRVVRDASTEYFFEKMPKGRHTFVEETLVDRNGTYECGISEIRSVYSPDFRAHTGGAVLTVRP